ncbi:chromosome partitioning protein ParB [Fibrobacteria bacterium R8-3-H12]
MSDSIAKFGDVLEPLIIRQRTKEEIKKDGIFPDAPYMLISGHRRLAAAKLAGLQALHCIVWENISPAEAFEMQLVENLHRADLLPMEEAQAYQRMSEELGYTHKEISLRVGRSEKHILRYIKLNSLADDLKEEIDSGETSIQKALFLCSLPEKTMSELLNYHRSFLAHDFSFAEFKEAIQRNYIADLNDNLPFKLNGKYGSLPKCTECPHKGTQPELFEEFIKEDKCPYSICFRDKKRIAMEEEAKAKAQAKHKGAEQQEAEEDEEPENWRPKEDQRDWEQDQRIQKAVGKVQEEWYVDKLFAKGINATDVFKASSFGYYNFIDDEYDSLFIKYIGKNSQELETNGTYEEILKAKIIDLICESIGDEEELGEWLNCEQCPDELLQKARAEAMGVKK